MPTRPTSLPTLIWRALASATLILACRADLHAASLSLTAAPVTPGTPVPLTLSLTSPAGSEPAALQFSFSYTPSALATISLTAGAETLSAGKTLTCSQSAGLYKCVISGLNQTAIRNGVIATGAATLASNVTTTQVNVTDSLAASPAAAQLALTGTTATLTVTTPPATSAAIRVNAGGGAVTDNLGQSWSADTGFSGGSIDSVTSPIAGTATPALYQTGRWQGGGFQYQFTVPNGAYTVTLKFAELYFTGRGQRRFSVVLNGQVVLPDFDIVATAGAPFTAVDRQFQTTVTNGRMTIQFQPGAADDPLVNAIELRPAPAVAVSPQTATLQSSQSQQFTATVTGNPSGTSNSVTWSVAPSLGVITSAGLYTAPAVISGDQQVSVVARSVADPTASATAAVSLRAAVSSFSPIRINVGGPALTDAQGQTWSADPISGGTVDSVTTAIAGTTTPALYQTARWQASPFQYQFAVPNGSYSVTLKFAELYFTSTGRRRFSVAVNGQVVLQDFDIVAAAGGAFKAVDRTIQTTVSNGQMLIQIQPGSADDPSINAIEIR